MTMRVVAGDLSDPAVVALLEAHVAAMRANSPPGMAYVLDLDGLRRPEIDFFAVREGEALLAIGALKRLDAVSGELKSMRTATAHLRRGAAARLLDHMIALARARGWRRLSLETGTGPYFDAALTLYRSRGFRNGAVFGDYAASAFNQFLHLDL